MNKHWKKHSTYLVEYPINDLEVEVAKFRNYLLQRRIPIEDSELNKMAQQVEAEITTKMLQETEMTELSQELLEEASENVGVLNLHL